MGGIRLYTNTHQNIHTHPTKSKAAKNHGRAQDEGRKLHWAQLTILSLWLTAPTPFQQMPSFSQCSFNWMKAESLSVYMGDWYLIRVYEASPTYKICWTGHQWYEQRNIDYVKHNTVVQPQSNTIH